MKAYRLDAWRLETLQKKRGYTNEQLLAFRVVYATDDLVLTKKAFSYYGMDDAKIKQLVDSGLFTEVEVSRNEALSIAGKHKFKTDPEYRATVRAGIKKAKDTFDALEGYPIYENWRTTATKRARFIRDKEARKRRKMLKTILNENYGGREVSILDVKELIEKDYQELRWEYREDFYNQLRQDMLSLGANITKGDRISRSFKKRFESDAEFRKKMRIRASIATHKRMMEYDKNPEKFEADIAKCNKARIDKMTTDPEYKKTVAKNLALGYKEFKRLYDEDPDFRAMILRKRGKSLEKANAVISRRCGRRREMLKRVAKTYFNDIFEVTPRFLIKKLEEYPRLNEKYPKLEDARYSMLKKDIARLRRDESAALAFPVDAD